MYQTDNRCWIWDSHIAYYPWTHSFVNVGFSHGGYSLQATNKREWRKERDNTYQQAWRWQHAVDEQFPSFASYD